MDLFVIFWVFLCLLIISTELIRKFLIFKANRDEKKRRRQRKEAVNLKDNSKPKR